MTATDDLDQLRVVQRNDAISFWTLCTAIAFSAILTLVAFALAFYAFAYSDDRIKGIVEILAGLLSIVAFTWIIATFILQWVGLRQQSIALRQSHGQIMRDVELVQKEMQRREARDIEEALIRRAGNVKYLSGLLCERLIGQELVKGAKAHLVGATGASGGPHSAGLGQSLETLAPGDGAERLLRLYFQDAPSVGETPVSLIGAINEIISDEGSWAYDGDGSAVITAVYNILSFEQLVTEFMDEMTSVLIQSASLGLSDQDLLAKYLRHDLGLAVIFRMHFGSYVKATATFDSAIWAVLEIDVESDQGYVQLLDQGRCTLLDDRARALGFTALVERLLLRREKALADRADVQRVASAKVAEREDPHVPF